MSGTGEDMPHQPGRLSAVASDRRTEVRLGRVLRRYRLMEELSLRSLGKQIGMSASTLLRIERGHDPSGRVLAAIFRWLTGEDEK